MVLCGFCYRPLTPQSGRMRECWYDCVIVIRDVFSTSSFFYHSSLCCHCSSIHFRLQLLAREPLKFFRTGVVSFVFSLFLSRCREFYLSSMGQYSVVKAFRFLMRRENLPNFVNVAGFKWIRSSTWRLYVCACYCICLYLMPWGCFLETMIASHKILTTKKDSRISPLHIFLSSSTISASAHLRLILPYLKKIPAWADLHLQSICKAG